MKFKSAILVVSTLGMIISFKSYGDSRQLISQCEDYFSRLGGANQYVVITPVKVANVNKPVDGCFFMDPFPDDLREYEDNPEPGRLKFQFHNGSKDRVFECTANARILFREHNLDEDYVDCRDSRKLKAIDIEMSSIAKPESVKIETFDFGRIICGVGGQISCREVECSSADQEPEIVVEDQPVNSRVRSVGKLCDATVTTKTCQESNSWKRSVKQYRGIYKEVKPGKLECVQETICSSGNNAYTVGQVFVEKTGFQFSGTALNSTCWRYETTNTCLSDGNLEINSVPIDEGYRTGNGKCDSKRSCSAQHRHGAKWSEDQYCGNFIERTNRLECVDGRGFVVGTTPPVRHCDRSGGAPLPGLAI